MANAMLEFFFFGMSPDVPTIKLFDFASDFEF